MKVSIGGGFLYDVASHLGFVLSFSYVLCRFVVAPGDHAFTWLVTVLASTLSSPGFLCCLAR